MIGSPSSAVLAIVLFRSQHAGRVNCQCFFCLPDRLIENHSIRLVPSLPRVGVCSKSDFIGAETVGSASDSLRLLLGLDLRRNRGDNGPVTSS